MKELVHDHPLSPLNLSHIPCGLNPHSSIFSPLASPSLSSPHLAFPNPSLLLAGQACLSNFLPHGYFRNHRLSTTQTLLSYWRWCRCSTPWPGSWTAGPRTPINPKSNESQSSGHDSASRPQSQTDCQVQTREGSHFSSLANSIMPSLLGTLPRPPVLTCSSHISSTSLWTVFEDRQSTHSFESFFTPWLHPLFFMSVMLWVSFLTLGFLFALTPTFWFGPFLYLVLIFIIFFWISSDFSFFAVRFMIFNFLFLFTFPVWTLRHMPMISYFFLFYSNWASLIFFYFI